MVNPKTWALENEKFLRSLRDFTAITEALSLPTGSTILDLGVGSGWTSILLAKIGYQVVGVDVSPKMIALANQRANQEGAKVNFAVGDIHNWQSSSQFDAVVCYDVLHHCYDVAAVLTKAANHLKSGGRLILLEPNFGHQFTASARAAKKQFGVRENGMRYRPLKHQLRWAGFTTVKRYYHPYPDRVYIGTAGFLKRLLNRTFYPK
ncbi:MAG: class I SAM-dependent methyltransferase [Patescibacteria group bacterium]|nr:class I SAM-dependent methyltransferase [Patescibacteria group bacterium]